VGDIFAETHGVKINRIKFSSLTAMTTIGDARVLLVKPQTYMNLSGGAVWQAMAFYKVPLEGVIAVTDDVALPLGKLRIRRRGSHGGHNGLRDISAKCGGDDFTRLRLGVGTPPEGWDMPDWVLSKFTPDDLKQINDSAAKAARALETIIVDGIDKAMSEFN